MNPLCLRPRLVIANGASRKTPSSIWPSARFSGRFFAAVVCVCYALLFGFSTPNIARAEPPVTALAFSPRDGHIVVASQRGLEIHDSPTALLARKTTGETIEGLPPAIHDLKFSPDGERLLVSGGIPAELGTVALLDWPARSLLWKKAIGEDIVYGSDWSPDGMFIAVASFDGVCRILDGKEGLVEQALVGHSAGLTDVAWIDEHRVLTASRDSTLRLWDASVGQMERTFNNHAGALAGVVARPSSSIESIPAGLPLAASIADDRTVRFWQPTIGRMVRFYRFDSARPVCAAWMPDGKLLAVGTTAGQVALIDPHSASVRATFDMSDRQANLWVTALVVQPDGEAIVAGSSTGNVQRFALPEKMH